MAIREATEADLPALMPLLRGYCEFYESDPPDAGLEAMARDVIGAPEDAGIVIVATGDDDEVIGFALSQWRWSSLHGARVLMLDDLFVAEPARGRGHADALIEATAEVARRHGAPIVTWLTTPDNRRAHTVYDRVGAKAEPLLEYQLEV